MTPSRWLKLGIIAMACADVWLIASNQLQAPNNELVAAQPERRAARSCRASSSAAVTLGYGDLFVAGLLGAVFAARVRVQRVAALLTLVVAALFDLLFLVVDNLPATVPVALALLIVEVGLARGRLRGTDHAAAG